MVGIIIVGHGKLASELLAVSEVILGKSDGVEALDFEMSEGLPDLEEKIRRAYQRRDEGSGVLALVDIKGGTPGNVCSLLSEELNMRIVSGMNLPMLIKALTYRHEKLERLTELVSEGAKQSIEELAV